MEISDQNQALAIEGQEQKNETGAEVEELDDGAGLGTTVETKDKDPKPFQD